MTIEIAVDAVRGTLWATPVTSLGSHCEGGRDAVEASDPIWGNGPTFAVFLYRQVTLTVTIHDDTSGTGFAFRDISEFKLFSRTMDIHFYRNLFKKIKKCVSFPSALRF